MLTGTEADSERYKAYYSKFTIKEIKSSGYFDREAQMKSEYFIPAMIRSTSVLIRLLPPDL
jgi:hypothetical protein